MSQVFGYARGSTSDQNSQMQLDALLEAGCDRILTEKASASGDRPELTHLFDLLRPGDIVVVWRLDRLGRSVHDLIELVEDLQSRGVALKSLRETIDTSSAGGRLVVHVFAALAEFEHDLIRERTVAGWPLQEHEGVWAAAHWPCPPIRLASRAPRSTPEKLPSTTLLRHSA